MHILGATRDDAAGECFDKTARVLGLGYPGGKPVDELSKGGDDKKYALPRSVIEGSPYDMSFSGLKTAVINLAHTAEQKGEELDKPSLAASFCKAVSDILVPRAMAAVREKGYGKLVVAGGVAANSRIRADFEREAKKAGIALYVPPLKLCGDNGAMIGAQGYYEFLAGNTAGSDLNAYANMEL
jgi:N6-L-threonylcarbamoyladenine synthase